MAEPAPEEAPRKGSPTALIVGVLALLFLGAVGVGVLLFLKSRWSGASPTPTPLASPSVEAGPTPGASPTPTEPALVLGALVVESEPAGASVTVNGELRGVTPLSLPDLALGEYEIKVESRGYQALTQKVTLADAQPVPVKATLSRNLPSQATLDVLSTPFGAAVSVDGTNIGQTPISGYKLKPGSHRIDVQRQGFEPWSETVKLSGGQSQRVDATLKALPPPTTQPPQRDVVDPNRVYELHEVDTRPKKVSGASVAYPSSAPRLKSGDSVSVRVSYVVAESGEVADVKVLESGGKLLDEAVAATVRSWKFTPGQKRGTRVKVQLQLKQTFQAG